MLYEYQKACWLMKIFSKNSSSTSKNFRKSFQKSGNNMHSKLLNNRKIYPHIYASFNSLFRFSAFFISLSLSSSYLELYPISHIRYFSYILPTCNSIQWQVSYIKSKIWSWCTPIRPDLLKYLCQLIFQLSFIPICHLS